MAHLADILSDAEACTACLLLLIDATIRFAFACTQDGLGMMLMHIQSHHDMRKHAVLARSCC